MGVFGKRMDMDMGGMSMSMSSPTMYRTNDSHLARSYWYIIVSLLAFILLLRGVDYYQTWSRLRISRTRRSTQYPTKVNNFPMQVYATATAILRETSYPQLYFGGMFSWLSPPPLGRTLIICCYWAVVFYMMFYKSVIYDAEFYERLGFRNAWISVTQVPLVYLLASKSSIIGCIIGSSHERLNWLHRWVSRTLLLTVTVHGGAFMAEWVRADFVKIELDMMPMVKYGIGAWFVLVWTFLSSLSPLRRMAYELFVLQHIAAAGVFLWLLWVHVPAYAQYNVWFAIAAISFDWILRGSLMLLKNIRVTVKKACNGTQRIGHEIVTEAISDDLTIVTIKDTNMTWTPGQHLYLWVPYLGPFESHPFTIATPYTTKAECHCNEIQLAIRAHSGFSKRLHNFASKNPGTNNNKLTGIVMGPYGVPPRWDAYETLVLISASTGASYTLPILESLLASQDTICTKRIFFLLVVRDRPHIQYYETRLSKALAQAEARGIDLDIEIAITGESSSLADEKPLSNNPIAGTTIDEKNASESDSNIEDTKKHPSQILTTSRSRHSTSSSSSSSSSLMPSPSKECCCNSSLPPSACCCAGPSIPTSQKQITYSYCRPDIAAFIRRPVEMTGGETAVAVCGGKSLVGKTRNSVVKLSDERAVHKGTGAQGVFLHVEEYCF